MIDLAARRKRITRDVIERATQIPAARKSEAVALFAKLQGIPRLAKNDRAAIARNLGRMVFQLQPQNRDEAAKRILGDVYWPKRKRYIRFSSDSSKRAARYAASGSTFARIAQQIIEEKRSKGADHDQAMVETINAALKGTSLQPSKRFKVVEHSDSAEGERDAAFIVKSLEKISTTLANEADLPDYFDLISKHPIYPIPIDFAAKREQRRLLKLDFGVGWCKPHNWNSFVPDDDDDELMPWLPWWAPKSVVGHLYVPFQTSCVILPKDAVADLKKICGNEITPDSWRTEQCLFEIGHLLEPRLSHRTHLYHRLPVWLTVLPSRNTSVLCLYVSFNDLLDDFQIEESLLEEEAYYYKYNEMTNPCFVDHVGDSLADDRPYFCADHDAHFNPPYVCAFQDNIKVIGAGLDQDVEHFDSHSSAAWSVDRLPPWLRDHPIDRLMQLTLGSDVALDFALTPRTFSQDTAFSEMPLETGGKADQGTKFRPAFPDTEMKFTRVRENTIAAYLLRNFTCADSAPIFEALRRDACAKHSAADELVGRELEAFQIIFSERYGE